MSEHKNTSISVGDSSIDGAYAPRESGFLAPVAPEASRLDVALNSGISNMGLDEYLKILGIEMSDLQGLVLDLGSGAIELFSREAAEAGVQVVSLNPKLTDEKARGSAKQGYFHGLVSIFYAIEERSKIDWQRRSAAGLAQELPFKDESFGTIVSATSVPVYVPNRDHGLALSEIGRVLKPGGKAYLAPIFEIDEQDPFDEQSFFDALQESGLPYASRNVEKEGWGRTYRTVTISKD